MATGPRSLDSGPKQPNRAGEGAYFEGEGTQPFEERTGDADSREAEAVVDDLISEFTGARSAPAPETRAGGIAPAPSAGGTAASNPEGTAGASGTGRGNASQAPAAGRTG